MGTEAPTHLPSETELPLFLVATVSVGGHLPAAGVTSRVTGLPARRVLVRNHVVSAAGLVAVAYELRSAPVAVGVGAHRRVTVLLVADITNVDA